MTEKLNYIEFRHVYKTFDHPVLVDVSFSVAPGETLAIIGRSGVGMDVRNLPPRGLAVAG